MSQIFGKATTESSTELTNAAVLGRSVRFLQEAAEAKLITEQDEYTLTEYCESDEDGQTDLLAENAQKYIPAFIRALASITNRDNRQYLLATLDEMTTVDGGRVAMFQAVQTATNTSASLILMRILTSETAKADAGQDADVFVASKAASLLARLSSGDGAAAAAAGDFSQWIITHIRNPQDGMIMLALNALKDVLKNPECHQRFNRDGGLRSLMMLTKETDNTQMLYLAVFSLWLLSFSESMLEEFKHHQVVYALVEIVRLVTREKVVRLVFSTLRNLLHKMDFSKEMVTFGLLKTLGTIRSRKWKDEDLVKDMARVEETLEECMAELSSFDMYKSEVEGGKLSWTPVHTENFWRENINKFEGQNFNLIRALVSLLDSEDDQVLEVACYDLGEFARFHPDGRIVLQQLNGKLKLMAVLSKSVDKAAVGKQALLAVQKLMVQNWESLQSSGGVAALMKK